MKTSTLEKGCPQGHNYSSVRATGISAVPPSRNKTFNLLHKDQIGKTNKLKALLLD